MFNFINRACQDKFRETTKTTKLAEVFDTGDDLNKQTKRFLKGTEEAVDMCAYDVEKCVNALRTYECINDLFEAVDIRNVIMKGTVLGSLLCTSKMDKLPQEVSANKDFLYKYKGKVDVPPIEMVDDILTTQKCEIAAEEMNHKVKAFIEQKKLTLGHKKMCKSTHWKRVF